MNYIISAIIIAIAFRLTSMAWAENRPCRLAFVVRLIIECPIYLYCFYLIYLGIHEVAGK